MTFVTRAEWGAREPDMTKIGSRSLGDVTDAIIHYADVIPPTDPAGVGYNIAEPDAATVRAIQNFHMDTRGWGDIAYNRLIAPDGEVFEGRLLGWVPAATFGANGFSVAYCVLTDGPITDQAKEALILQLHADMAPQGRYFDRVKSHRDYNPTACPGDTIAAWVAEGLPLVAPVSPPGPPVAIPCHELPPGPPPAGHPFLALGSVGSAVADLQSRLSEVGAAPLNSKRADGTWDGIFGPLTDAAVRMVQSANGLTVDGKVGRQTWCALGVR